MWSTQVKDAQTLYTKSKKVLATTSLKAPRIDHKVLKSLASIARQCAVVSKSLLTMCSVSIKDYVLMTFGEWLTHEVMTPSYTTIDKRKE